MSMENRIEELDDFKPVLCNDTKHKSRRSRNKASCYRDFVLTAVSTFGGLEILYAFLLSYGLGSFLLSLLLCLFTAVLTLMLKKVFP